MTTSSTSTSANTRADGNTAKTKTKSFSNIDGDSKQKETTTNSPTAPKSDEIKAPRVSNLTFNERKELNKLEKELAKLGDQLSALETKMLEAG